MNKQIAVIVQARIASSRLPGKILLPLGGKSALSQCLLRCQSIRGITHVVCAIPEGSIDNPIVDEAVACGCNYIRGPLDDVLKRYLIAADDVQADIIMRVTSDCPLIDPETCSEMLNMFLESDCDYLTNNMPPSWPHGFDAEIFTYEALLKADLHAHDRFDREHVTPWIRRCPDLTKKNYESSDLSLNKYRVTLDYLEDYVFLSSLFKLLPSHNDLPSRNDVLSVLRNNPDLVHLNHSKIGLRAIDPKLANHP